MHGGECSVSVDFENGAGNGVRQAGRLCQAGIQGVSYELPLGREEAYITVTQAAH